MLPSLSGGFWETVVGFLMVIESENHPDVKYFFKHTFHRPLKSLIFLKTLDSAKFLE